MEFILRQIEQSLDIQLHYLAVVSVLTLPDVCSALETKRGETDPKLYEKWVDERVSPTYPQLTGHDLYRLRCGVVHQGRLGPRGMQYDLIAFMITGAVHRNIFKHAGAQHKSVLQLDVNLFCRDLIQIVREWYVEKTDEPNVKRNLPFVLQYRSNGLPPHIAGMPIIA